MTCGAENCSDGPFFRSAAFDEKDYGDCGYIWYEDVKNLLMIVGVCVCVVASIPFWETSAWRDFWQSLFYVTIKGAEKHPAENLPKIASFLVCLSSTAVPSILFACM